MNVPGDDFQKDRFHQQYGATLHAWGTIENTFSLWFTQLTAMNSKVAREIFYTPNGFLARIDVFLAAMKHGELNESLRPLLIAIVKKSRSYNQIRNRVVHGLVVRDARPGSPTAGQYVLMEGNDYGTPDSSPQKTSIDDLVSYEQAFRALDRLMFDAFAEAELPPSSLEKYLQRVSELPKFQVS